MIAVIDYGMGNLRSVEKALKKLGTEAEIVCDAKRLSLSDKAVLPGVGAFRDTMQNLDKSGMVPAIREYIDSGKPYLGICLGLQILFEESEEGGLNKGLGILKGRVERFPEKKGLKVPHMGWNQIKIRKGRSCPLLKGIEDNSYLYFVHSYYAIPKKEGVVVTTTGYGVEFTSMVWRDNLYAVQFHPEKSQAIGLKILRNFVEL